MNDMPTNPANGQSLDSKLSRVHAPERETQQNPRFPTGWVAVPKFPVPKQERNR